MKLGSSPTGRSAVQPGSSAGGHPVPPPQPPGAADTGKLINDNNIEAATVIAPKIVKNCGETFSIFRNNDDIIISFYKNN